MNDTQKEAALDERQVEEAKEWISYMRSKKGVHIIEIARAAGYLSRSMLPFFITGRLNPLQEKRVAARIMALKESNFEDEINNIRRETCPTCGQPLFIQ